MARIYISSTYEDLKDCREEAYHALRRLRHDVVAMEDYVAADARPLDSCLADVAKCDVYVGLIGWRYGFVPTTENLHQRSITELEYRKAEELKKPRLLFLVDETAPWLPKFVDKGAAAKRVKALRDEVTNGRLASFFASKHELAEKVAVAVTNWERGRSAVAPVPIEGIGSIQLRKRGKEQPLPQQPYPLLQPYEHPATFAGRDRELDELERRVCAPQLILCMYAPSGAGKSSLLLAGLLPRFRALEHPVSLDRHPGEPGIARRIVSDLFDVSGGFSLDDEDVTRFSCWIEEAGRQAGDRPPVIVLDQIDDALRLADRGVEALARLGPLMAATAQRFDGQRGYVCRWVLCYRHEFHGLVHEWLEDVLRHARARGHQGLETLPYNLSEPDRLHRYVVPVMGAPPPGGADATESVGHAFRDAIERPLTLRRPDGSRAYALRFAEQGARRLADAFARARARDPDAVLVPELQVVLRHLINSAPRDAEGVKVIRVPETDEQLDGEIVDALRSHVRRVLEEIPWEADNDAVKQSRARALLALRHLADAYGRRGRGVPRARLEAAIGERAGRVLDRLASQEARLIVADPTSAGVVYSLAHDGLAEVVKRLVEDPQTRRDFGLDDALVELRRFVEQRADLFVLSHDETALTLTAEQHDRIEKSAGALLWNEHQRAWWVESDRWFALSRRFAESAQAGFGSLVDLVHERRADWRGLQQRLEAASVPADVFWFGPWNSQAGQDVDQVDLDQVLQVIRQTYPAFLGGNQKRWETFRGVAHAIEEVVRRAPEGSQTRASALKVRQEVRQAFASRYPTVALPPLFRGDAWHLPDDPLVGFVEIPEADPFLMGSDKQKDPSAFPHEHWPPRGQGTVRLPTFYLARYPVTVSQFRAFVRATEFPLGYDEGLNGKPAHPMVFVSWHEALAYADWLQKVLREWPQTPALLRDRLRDGWRVSLPSEAEWEKAARGGDGRIYPWGNDIDPDRANYARSGIGGRSLVGAFPRGASPYDVHDLSGNVWEWTRTLWGQDEKDPTFGYPYKPNDGRENLRAANEVRRVVRGGSFSDFERLVRAAFRSGDEPDNRSGNLGFRVVVSRF